MPQELIDLLARLAELTRPEVEDLRTRLQQAGEDLSDADTAENISVLGQIADAYEQAGTRLDELQTEAAELEQTRADALARLRPAGTDAADADAPADGGTDAPAATDAEPEPVAASTTPRPLPAMGGARTTPRGAPTPTVDNPRVETSLVAAADLQGVSAGATFTDRAEVGRAFDARREAVARSRGAQGDRVPVFTMRSEFDESRRLRKGDLDGNERKVAEASSEEALVAAAAARNAQAEGGSLVAAAFCAPFENLYDVEVLGVTDRPVRDALLGFGADRGGINWRPAPRMADLDAATGFWTEVEEDDPAAEKDCLEVLCTDGETAKVEAVYTCLKFRNTAARFDPEMTEANIDLALVAAARKAEVKLLGQLAATSTTVTTAKLLGVVRDLLVAVDHVIAAYRSQHRLNTAVTLRAIMPQWLMDAMRSDVARSMGSAYDLEALALAEARITAWFTRRNVNITWALDGRAAIVGGSGIPAMAAQTYGAFTPGGAVPGYPDQVEWFLFPEGSVLFLDGGTLDVGLIRDSALVAQNAYKSFTESWEGIANRAVETLRVVSTVQPTGQVAGTVDTSAVND